MSDPLLEELDQQRRRVALNGFRTQPATSTRNRKSGILRGHAAVFNSNSEDLGGFIERIKPGCFVNTLRKADVRALINHDPNLVLGRLSAGTLRLREDATGLAVEIDLPDASHARDLLASIERGDVSQMSFGFRCIRDEWHRENGITIRTLLEVNLLDVSPVTFPAYVATRVTAAS